MKMKVVLLPFRNTGRLQGSTELQVHKDEIARCLLSYKG